MEEWRKIPGFGNYEINIATKEGACRNTNWHGKTRLFDVKPNKKTGRILWGLVKDGKHIVKQAAVWIAMTYPELVQNEYFEGAEIDHIDTDRLNNHPSNLRWVTRTENMRNPLTRERTRKTMTGKKQTDTTCKRRSESMMGHKGYWTGKKMPEEARKKMSEAHKKREP